MTFGNLCYTTVMKKLLLSVVVLIVTVLSAVGATNHYHNYQDKKDQETAALTQAAVAADNEQINQINTLQAANDELQSRHDDLVAECKKGVVAYGKLSQLVQEQTPKPSCGKTESN